MKKLIITNCILAIAVIFTYCAKPDLNEELSSVNSGEVASNRTVCVITVNPANTATLTFCGTNTNANQCSSCTGDKKTGTDSLFGPGSITVNAPTELSISSNINTSVNLNGNPPVAIPAGGCRKFKVDANCVITPI